MVCKLRICINSFAVINHFFSHRSLPPVTLSFIVQFSEQSHTHFTSIILQQKSELVKLAGITAHVLPTSDFFLLLALMLAESIAIFTYSLMGSHRFTQSPLRGILMSSGGCHILPFCVYLSPEVVAMDKQRYTTRDTIRLTLKKENKDFLETHIKTTGFPISRFIDMLIEQYRAGNITFPHTTPAPLSANVSELDPTPLLGASEAILGTSETIPADISMEDEPQDDESAVSLPSAEKSLIFHFPRH